MTIVQESTPPTQARVPTPPAETWASVPPAETLSAPRVEAPPAPLAETPPWREGLAIARDYLGNQWALLALGGAVLVAAAALNWGWLVAVGLAPILIAVAPCAIMCALGLCAMKMTKDSK